MWNKQSNLIGRRHMKFDNHGRNGERRRNFCESSVDSKLVINNLCYQIGKIFFNCEKRIKKYFSSLMIMIINPKIMCECWKMCFFGWCQIYV